MVCKCYNKSKIKPFLYPGIESHEYYMVSGSDWKHCTGLYHLSDEISSEAPNKPVFKLHGENRYIYYHPSPEGWRIGRKNHLAGQNAGQYFYKSKNRFYVPVIVNRSIKSIGIFIFF